jgi:two-component system, OmpR family, alkaline phosphatase synthesis response regulator PhoP
METFKNKKILVIEDEEHLAEGLNLSLSLEGYKVIMAKDGQEGVEVWERDQPDLIVLDIMMPRLNGYQVLEVIRKKDARLPILILSAKNEPKDKVKALKKGVDDYLEKPFELEEFLLRIQRLLQRAVWTKPPPKELRIGESKVNLHRQIAQTPRGEFPLTDQEIKILNYFLENPQRAIPRQELLQQGWGYEASTSTRTLDNFIVRLRKYFETDPKKPHYFISIRSVGYLFNPEGKGR